MKVWAFCPRCSGDCTADVRPAATAESASPSIAALVCDRLSNRVKHIVGRSGFSPGYVRLPDATSPRPLPPSLLQHHSLIAIPHALPEVPGPERTHTADALRPSAGADRAYRSAERSEGVSSDGVPGGLAGRLHSCRVDGAARASMLEFTNVQRYQLRGMGP